MKSFPTVLLLAALSGCASMRARQHAGENAVIAVTVSAPIDVARSRVIAAFMANKLAVSSQQDQLIEAKLPREDGFLGKYDIVARAVLIPTAGGTRVTLYGEELRTSEASLSGGGSTTSHGSRRVNQFSTGRAGDVWKQLEAIAESLRSSP